MNIKGLIREEKEAEEAAEEVGLQAEDIIVSINDQDFLGKKPEEASNLIKGSEDEKVKLKIARGNEYKEPIFPGDQSGNVCDKLHLPASADRRICLYGRGFDRDSRLHGHRARACLPLCSEDIPGKISAFFIQMC